jgi:hypothetical protein
MSFEETLRSMAEGSGTSAQTPIVTIIVTVEEDLTRNEAELELASIRQEILAGDPLVQNVTQDYTVNSFAAETASSISWEDARNVRSSLRNAVRDEGMTLRGSAIQADIKTASL